MNILFVDTETNGKPTNYKAHHTDVDCWPRCIQLAYQVADLAGKVVHQFNSLISPDGWTIPTEPFFINNDFNTERNRIEGIPMADALDILIQLLEAGNIELIVSHNIHFDYSVIAAEMVRYKKRSRVYIEKACTMEAGVHVCKLPFANRKRPRWGEHRSYKWPTLNELHKHLFGSEIDNAHDALVDVNACRLCFFEMLNRGIIVLQPKDVTVKDVA
jgi:DNA polymerase III subunit epsilon